MYLLLMWLLFQVVSSEGPYVVTVTDKNAVYGSSKHYRGNELVKYNGNYYLSLMDYTFSSNPPITNQTAWMIVPKHPNTTTVASGIARGDSGILTVEFTGKQHFSRSDSYTCADINDLRNPGASPREVFNNISGSRFTIRSSSTSVYYICAGN